jgi:hypothetical protein
VRTIRALAGFLQNGLLGLLDDQCLETSIVDKRAPPSWVAILQQNTQKLDQNNSKSALEKKFQSN